MSEENKIVIGDSTKCCEEGCSNEPKAWLFYHKDPYKKKSKSIKDSDAVFRVCYEHHNKYYNKISQYYAIERQNFLRKIRNQSYLFYTLVFIVALFLAFYI